MAPKVIHSFGEQYFEFLESTVYVVWNEQKQLVAIALYNESWEAIKKQYGEKHLKRDEIALIFIQTVQQLQEYFSGDRKDFSLPLSLHGTEFQKQVWEQLQAIPYGITISYSELAQKIGNPSAVRAVGQANRRNPIPIIVPCHRVIGKSGSLTGYAGPSHTQTKASLLKLEGV